MWAAYYNPAMAWLLALTGDLLGRWFPLDSATLVGRASLNHVIIDDPRISRQHAKIAPEEGGYVLYDLNSANGTYINDEPVKRQRLEHGATIRFGPFAFAFKETRERAPTVPSTPFVVTMEVRTLHGMGAPVKIVDSLEVSSDGEGATSLTVLEDAYRKLSKLHEFFRSIASTLDTAELIDRIIAHLMMTFSAREVEVFVYDERTSTLRPHRHQHYAGEVGVPRPLSPQIVEEVVRRARAVLSTTAAAPGEEGGTAMHAPIINGTRLLGALGVRENLTGERFHQRDLDLFAGLVAAAALALHNARMHADLLRQQRLEQDLQLAQQIQMSFLPRTLPSAPRVEVVTEYTPVYSIGGDFYDVVWLDEKRMGIFIGDVAGKGVAAALLMARVSSDVRVAVSGGASPGGVLARVNLDMLEREQSEEFVTGVFLSLDVETGKVVLANAGHCPPLIRRAGGAVERIDEAATAMGFFRDTLYQELELTLAPGDAIVLYTDGVAEAQSSSGEELGAARIAAALAGEAGDADAIAELVLDDLRGHVLDAQQVDDMTLIVCRFK
jgi:phosphoserine phosphatase RsbU/P